MRFALVPILLSLLAVDALAKSPRQPNIVFILADDLSWSDLGCYGHPYHHTPSLDQLAAEGLRLISGYSPAPICSAARASILAGKTVARLGFEFVTKDQPGSQALDVALRQGDNKVIQFAEDGRIELYDLAADVSEQHDLSKQRPAVASELRKLLHQQLDAMNARRALPRK